MRTSKQVSTRTDWSSVIPSKQCPAEHHAIKPPTDELPSTQGGGYERQGYVPPPELSAEQIRAVQAVTGKVRPAALNEFRNILLGNLLSFDQATSGEKRLCERACKEAGIPLGRSVR